MQLNSRPILSLAIFNSGWLLLDRVLRVIAGMIVVAWIARYLGPQQFGVMSYGFAIIALVGAIAGMGLNGIVVRELVRQPGRKGEILGTSFGLQIVGGLFAWLIALFLIMVLKPGDIVEWLIVATFGSTLVFKAADTVRYFYESKMKSRKIVITENLLIFLVMFFKIGLIYIGASLMAFVWMATIESILISIAIIIRYSVSHKIIHSWKISLNLAKQFLMESWPIMLVALVSVGNIRIDQIILGRYASDLMLGNYIAAAKLSEMWLIIPSIIGPSIFPVLIKIKEQDHIRYRNILIFFTKIMAIISLLGASFVSLFANEIIKIIYGDGYDIAASFLSILIWSGVPYISLFAISQIYYLEGLVKYILYISIVALVLGVCLNLILVPLYQGYGAAISVTVTAFITSAFSLILIGKKTNIFLN